MSFALIPNVVVVFLGALLPLVFSHWLLWTIGFALIVLGLVGSAGVLLMMRSPRLGYAHGELFVNLQRGQPIAVPVDQVECFFLGQADSLMPKQVSEVDDSETTTVVVRLAEAAEEWQHREVLPSLGHWCDGYITIRGTWCEPINGELIKGLNHRLVEIHRTQRASAKAGS